MVFEDEEFVFILCDRLSIYNIGGLLYVIGYGGLLWL